MQDEHNRETIRQDSFDRQKFRDIRQQPRVNHWVQQGQQEYKQWANLMQDVFASYYKPAPELKEKNCIAPEAMLNHALVEQLLGSDHYRQLHYGTKLDAATSTFAMLGTAAELLEQLKQNKDTGEIMDAVNALEELKQQKRKPTTSQDPGADRQQKLEQEIEEKLQNPFLNLRQVVAAATREASKKTDEAIDAMIAFAIAPGDWHNMPADKVVDFMQLLVTNPGLRRITNLAGQMKNIVHAKKHTRLRHGQDEVHSVTLGNEFPRLLPSELMLLGDPDMEDLFYSRWLEKKCLQYDLRARVFLGQGPIVILKDASGSMNSTTPDGCLRHEHATAMCLAMLEIARLQKRQVAVVVFQGDGEYWTFRFDPRNLDVAALIDLATRASDGGTSYETALDEGLRLITESAAYKEADMVLITDGECWLSDEYLRKLSKIKEQKAFHIYSLLVQTRQADGVEQFSDEVYVYNGAPDAGGVFERLLSPEGRKEGVSI